MFSCKLEVSDVCIYYFNIFGICFYITTNTIINVAAYTDIKLFFLVWQY